MWKESIGREWGRIWARGGGYGMEEMREELQRFADVEWRRCVGCYEELLRRGYEEVVGDLVEGLEREEEVEEGYENGGRRRRKGRRGKGREGW